MNNIKNIVAKNITELRQSRKMTQMELAEQLNYSDKAVSKWEHADSMPDVSTLVDIANLFGVTLDYLVNEEHEEKICNSREKSAPKYSHGIITAVSVLLVWFISLFVFVMVTLISGKLGFQWISFVYAVPVSAIVYLVFNSIWFNTRFNYFIISVLMWSVIASVQITLMLFRIDILMIYLLGIPGQIVIILWSMMKKRPKKGTQDTEIKDA